MFDYDLAGAVGPGTTTLTRKATMVRGPPRTGGGGGNGVNGSFPSSPTQQDQLKQKEALEWSQRQQPTFGSRPHTRTGQVPGLALHGAEVAGVVNRPSTRNTGLPMLVLHCHACPLRDPTPRKGRCTHAPTHAPETRGSRRSQSVTPGPVVPKLKGAQSLHHASARARRRANATATQPLARHGGA